MRYTLAYTIDHSQPLTELPGEYATEREARDAGIVMLAARLDGQSSAGEWAWSDQYGRTGYLYVYGN